jgi:DNA-binding MarR family transcriptional regulator
MERHKTNTKEIFKHLRVVDAFRSIDQDMPIGQVAFFLHASREEGSSLRDVAQMANCKMATASRYLSTLSVRGRKTDNGLDLLFYEENPVDRRQKLIYLSDKGKKLLETLAMKGA